MRKKTVMPTDAPAQFNHSNFHTLCDQLGNYDADLKRIIDQHGYPPMWTRPNNFETLVHVILEQQVSLASALASLKKLQHELEHITPDAILSLNDEEMRACFVSRQKTVYIRGLAQAINNGEINLNEFEDLPNDDVREKLIQLKGVGNWTIDVYLMFALQRTDIFPVGDLAAVNALKRLKQLASTTTREEILEISTNWQPLRTIASMLLWHYYLSNTGKKIAPVQ